MSRHKEIWRPLIHRNIIKDRYLISSRGRIKSLYRLNKKSEKFYFKTGVFIKPYSCQQNTSTRASLCVGHNKMKAFFINTLMISIFKIKKPDKFNQYIPHCIDGNIFNNSLNNIAFRKFTQYKTNPTNYESKNIVENGKLVAKVCCQCGKKKTPEKYMVSNNNGHRITLKNKCVQCSSKERWNKIKSDPRLFKKEKEQKRKWNLSTRGKEYHLEFGRNQRKNLHDGYVIKYIKKTMNNIPKEFIPKPLIDIYRIKMRTYRELQKLKQNICLHK